MIGAVAMQQVCSLRVHSLLVSMLASALVVGCDKQPGSTLESKFGTPLPVGVQVEHFEWSGAGMDHWYLWVIKPADAAFVQSLIKSAGLNRATSRDDASGLHSNWPTWWPQKTIESLPECYFRNDGREYLRVWVDSKRNCVYMQWFDT